MSSSMRAEDFDVAADIRRAETLPALAFTDRDYLDRELRTLFTRNWQLVPLRTAAQLRDDGRSLLDLARPRGSRVPFTLLDRPLFLQRGWSGDELVAHPNACTHAWFPLVSGPSRGASVTCGQHGRKFDANGRYVSQPGFERCADMPREEDHLARYPVHEWLELLLAVPGTPDVAASEIFAPINASLARLPLGNLKRRALDVEERVLEGNWKQHAWNYMDKYHVTWIHRAPGGLGDRLDMSDYRTELHGLASLQWAFAREPSHGFDPALLPERFAKEGRRVFALWWFVFPNLTLNFYPWGLSVNVYQPMPGEPQKTRFLWYHFVLDDQKYAQRDDIWLNEQVDREDVDAMAQVRRGLASGGAVRGRFAPDDEHGPHWFHRRCYESTFG